MRIPGYVIKRELGRGGMATVYLALQTSLDREVALKVMNPTLASDESFSRRFLAEARTVAKLSHPHIVAVYDVGVTATGVHYFSMQHLPAGDLADRIARGLDADRVASTLRALLSALAFAHERGVVHRDLAPRNILFTADGSPVLTDFGIARVLGPGAHLSEAGIAVGTSHYMSPEQARGAELDVRSDLYSLGVVAYEMLAGHPPFQGEDSFAIAYAHVFDPLPALPEAFAAWQPLIQRALEKDPQARYSDSAAFLAALNALVGGSPQGPPTEAVTRPMPIPATTANNTRPVTVTTAASPKPAARPAPPASAPIAAKPRNWPAWAGGVAALTGVALIVLALVRSVPSESGAAAVPPAAVAQSSEANPLEPASEVIPVVAEPMAASLAETADPLETPSDGAFEDSELIGIDVTGGFETTPGANPPQEPEPVVDQVQLDLERLMAAELADGDVPDEAVPEEELSAVEQLLAQARIDLFGQRWLTPPGNNAFERYQEVLALEPGNAAALRGLRRILERYDERIGPLLAEGSLGEARVFVERAVTVAGALPEAAAEVATRRAVIDSEIDTRLRGARTAMAQWRRDEALRLIGEAQELDPGRADLAALEQEARMVGREGFRFRDRFSDGGDGPELVVLGPGRVGASGNAPALTINQAIGLALTPVTVADYERFTRSSGRPIEGGCRDQESRWRSARNRSWRAPGFDQGPDHPVVCVSHDDAEAYAAWLSRETGSRYRLPSEAEWLYAARELGAASGDACALGNIGDRSSGEASGRAGPWPCSDGSRHTAPVSRFATSGDGVYDLAGNSRDWLADCGAALATNLGQAANRGGDCRERVLRGASWYSGRDDAAVNARESWRTGVTSNTAGFRLVRDLAP